MGEKYKKKIWNQKLQTSENRIYSNFDALQA